MIIATGLKIGLDWDLDFLSFDSIRVIGIELGSCPIVTTSSQEP